MYGYIENGGAVGELFAKKPPKEQYHMAYWERIVKLPKGVGAGWRKEEGGGWVTPDDAGRAGAEAAARRERDALLGRADTVYCNAANWELMDAEEKAAWHVYKQALRDLPEQAGFPFEAVWPDIPGGDGV
jgi:hypothetical protein